MTRAIIVVCAVVLAGCAATGPVFQAAPEPKEADALIYIYRPSSSWFALGARDAYFYVNEVNVADLSNEGYTWFHVPAGDYTLTQKWPFDATPGAKALNINARWLPKQKYYFRLETAAGYRQYLWRVSEVPADRALIEISSCKYQPAFGVEKLLQKLSIK